MWSELAFSLRISPTLKYSLAEASSIFLSNVEPLSWAFVKSNRNRSLSDSSQMQDTSTFKPVVDVNRSSIWESEPSGMKLTVGLLSSAFET